MGRILIVDDNMEACLPLARLMNYLGYQSECVESGEKALEKLRCAIPDLLILDVMMPGMDGMEVLRTLRAEPRTARIPVVMFSAVADPAFRAHAINKGATDYWVKASFDYTDLETRLHRLLGDSSGG